MVPFQAPPFSCELLESAVPPGTGDTASLQLLLRRFNVATLPIPSARFTRRVLVGSSLAGTALLPLASTQRGHAAPLSRAASDAAAYQESTSVSEWRTWYLSSADQLRPEAPGDPTEEEINEVIQLQGDSTDEITA